MQVRREPVARPQRIKQLARRRRAKRPVVDLGLQEGLLAEERARVAVPRDVLWPVVREEDVERLGELPQPEDLELTHVVDGAHGVVTKGWTLMVALRVVPPVEDAREPADAHTPHLDHTRKAEEEDVRCGPAAVKELVQVRARLVVAADEDGQHRRYLLAGVVLVEGLHRAVLGRARHAL